VVFAGRRWGGPGPDFRGAVLALADGTLVRGDVEIHVRASSWTGHHHWRDPAYGGVVLHVVARADAIAMAGDGQHLPTVVLEPEPRAEPSPRPARAERSRRSAPVVAADDPEPCLRHAAALLAVVRAAGTRRFLARAARFEGDLAFAAADQVLWRGVCEALGYRRNRAPFARLAEAVPWTEAALVVRQRGPVGLSGLLLGTAGLLAEATLPEAHAWHSLRRTRGARPALARASWDRRQLRAGNAPAARCRGLAEVAARWSAERWRGPAVLLLEAVRRADAERHPRLWQQVLASPWIGRGRAQVVAINVLLPFAYAAGVPRAMTLFERLPGEPSNRVVRYMASQLNGSGRTGVGPTAAGATKAGELRFRGAWLQQGLLELFGQTCARRMCERCPARRGGGGGAPGATTLADEASDD
jgi:hypothetical protein